MRILLILSALIICSMPLLAQQIINLPITDSSDTIKWPTAEKEYFSPIWATQVVTNVSEPSMEIFLADEPNGAAVVICPGGALYAHSINSEGRDVAKYLNSIGVSAFVLKYRLVPCGEDAVNEVNTDGMNVKTKAMKLLTFAASDAANAIAYVREQSDEWKLDPNRIGLMGFSAGGAVTMQHLYTSTSANMPNFIAPIYAWMDVVSPQKPPADAPPAFITCATDDPLNLAPASVQIYSDWLELKKPVELHMYAKGGHGFGMRKQDLPTDEWVIRFGEWLKTMF